jgi:hypothetical protein
MFWFLKEGTFVLPRLPPMLRGSNPEENLIKLQTFIQDVDAKDDEELAAEIALIEKALAPPVEEAPAQDEAPPQQTGRLCCCF